MLVWKVIKRLVQTVLTGVRRAQPGKNHEHFHTPPQPLIREKKTICGRLCFIMIPPSFNRFLL